MMEKDVRGATKKVGAAEKSKEDKPRRAVPKSEIDLAELRRYFQFFDRYSDHPCGQFWIITAHPRKANWDRGGNILKELKKVDFTRPVGGADGMVNYVRRIHGYMLSLGKSADLHIKESPEVGKYYRIVFIDDLELYFLEQLASDYSGPIAAIETSPDNFQAMLITPRFPVDETRTKFRGLLEDEVFAIQKHLSSIYKGDMRAVAANQERRFAQSPNYKNSQNGERPFYAQIAILQQETGSHLDAEKFLIEAINSQLQSTANVATGGQPAQPRPGRPAAARPAPGGRDESESGEAFRYSLRRLRWGVSPVKVEAEVAARWGTGRAADWPKRTVHNARWQAQMAHERYTSGGTNH